jgi:hypothetical protein
MQALGGSKLTGDEPRKPREALARLVGHVTRLAVDAASGVGGGAGRYKKWARVNLLSRMKPKWGPSPPSSDNLEATVHPIAIGLP